MDRGPAQADERIIDAEQTNVDAGCERVDEITRRSRYQSTKNLFARSTASRICDEAVEKTLVAEVWKLRAVEIFSGSGKAI